MIKHELISSLKHSEKFDSPQGDKNVWAYQVCLAFEKRYSPIGVVESCFFVNILLF